MEFARGNGEQVFGLRQCDTSRGDQLVVRGVQLLRDIHIGIDERRDSSSSDPAEMVRFGWCHVSASL